MSDPLVLKIPKNNLQQVRLRSDLVLDFHLQAGSQKTLTKDRLNRVVIQFMTPEPVGFDNRVELGSTLVLSQVREGGWFLVQVSKQSPPIQGFIDDATAIPIFDQVERLAKE